MQDLMRAERREIIKRARRQKGVKHNYTRWKQVQAGWTKKFAPLIWPMGAKKMHMGNVEIEEKR